MKIFVLMIIVPMYFFNVLVANENPTNHIWLKTYQNYKNYNTIISNNAKLETKINTKNFNIENDEQLRKRLSLYRSKLSLYEKNNSFDNLLIKYKYDIPIITFKEFILKSSSKNLDRLLQRYQQDKNSFYLALSTLKMN